MPNGPELAAPYIPCGLKCFKPLNLLNPGFIIVKP